MRVLLILSLCLLSACHSPSTYQKGDDGKIRLITVAPAHFHAALLQKQLLAELDTNVYVYAPQGKELDNHLALIESYNRRSDNPTHWHEIVYSGKDFFEKMLKDKPGEVVVLAGNNQQKTSFILASVANGLNVLADKPMAIDSASFDQLVQAFAIAAKKKVLLYDIMTERYDLVNKINRAIIGDKTVFGDLQTGLPGDPAVRMESVHYFYKNVSGKPLIRPAWYYDVKQQGEGLVDVTTHLVDLIHWSCFPGQTIAYEKDIHVIDARHWATRLTRSEFKKSTSMDDFPPFLSEYVKDSLLNVYANGVFDYTVKGSHVRVAVTWNFEAPEGSGDLFRSVVKGSKATTSVLQGNEQDPLPRLYVRKEQTEDGPAFKAKLEQLLHGLQQPALSLHDCGDGLFEIIIPAEERSGHEAHFAEVASKYFDYLKHHTMPEWEVPNMLAKYYITTKALTLAREKERDKAK